MRTFFIITTAILLFSIKSFGQSNKDGAFGAISFRSASILKQNAVIAGGRFGWIINNSIVIGGSYYSLFRNVHVNTLNNPDIDSPLLDFNYGGLEFEYIFFASSPIHFSVSSLFAGGGLYFNTHETNKTQINYFALDLLVYEPSFNIEANTLKWLHVDLTLSYRIISSFKGGHGITKDDLKGLSAGLTFKLGSY